VHAGSGSATYPTNPSGATTQAGSGAIWRLVSHGRGCGLRGASYCGHCWHFWFRIPSDGCLRAILGAGAVLTGAGSATLISAAMGPSYAPVDLFSPDDAQGHSVLNEPQYRRIANPVNNPVTTGQVRPTSVTAGGESIPAVDPNARFVGVTDNGIGAIYEVLPGTPGLDPRVTLIRVAPGTRGIPMATSAISITLNRS
jgi:hypothetical protein